MLAHRRVESAISNDSKKSVAFFIHSCTMSSKTGKVPIFVSFCSSVLDTDPYVFGPPESFHHQAKYFVEKP
jgi:hypothetical protein